MKKRKEKQKRAMVWFVLFVIILALDLYFVKSFIEDSVVANTDDYLSEDVMINEANTDNLSGKDATGQSQGAIAGSNNKVLLDVPYINQTKHYINACESISTVMALQYLGIDISVDDFINKYLDIGEVPYHDKNGVYIGSSPWEVFPGNPRDETGWGCYAPVIVNALNKFIDKDTYDVQELYNERITTLCSEYIDNGIPVIFWATINMQAPYKGSTWKLKDSEGDFTWIRPMHCVLLVGYDDEYYYFNDPWEKKACKYKKAIVERAYRGMYQQAVVVTKK